MQLESIEYSVNRMEKNLSRSEKQYINSRERSNAFNESY